jgi:hypothetical protein
MDYTRKGKTWTINECLQLQREYELLEWSIPEIALKHKRTPEAIMSKIIKEEFVDYEIYENILIYKNIAKAVIEENSCDGDSNYESHSESDSNYESDSENNHNSNNDTYNKDDFNDLKNHVKNLEIKLSTMIELFERQHKTKMIDHSTLFN